MNDVANAQIDRVQVDRVPVDRVQDKWTRSLDTPWTPDAKRPKQTCGFAGCTAPWSRLLRRNGRPGFEGKWGCSRACLRAMVDEALRRVLSDGVAAEIPAEHRHRVPLGLVLLAQGWITHPQLRHALSAQRAAGRGRIGEWLVRESGVAETDVTRGLSVQWNCPVLSPAAFDANAMALVMPACLRNQLGLLPLKLAGDRLLYLGFENGVDAAAALAVERMSGIAVECGLLSAMDYGRSVARLRQAKEVACKEENLPDVQVLGDRLGAVLNAAQPHDARVTRVRDRYWLRMWLEPASVGPRGLLPRTGEDVLDHVFRIDTAA